jgi:hypothetical protein
VATDKPRFVVEPGKAAFGTAFLDLMSGPGSVPTNFFRRALMTAVAVPVVPLFMGLKSLKNQRAVAIVMPGKG